MHDFLRTLGLFALILLAGAAWAQDDVLVLAPKAFAKPQRPAVRFPHARHAEGRDCTACHHVYQSGQNVWTPGEATVCSGCHGLKSSGRTPGLMPAYHRLCQDCHLKEAGAGRKPPVLCGQCHAKPKG